MLYVLFNKRAKYVNRRDTGTNPQDCLQAVQVLSHTEDMESEVRAVRSGPTPG